MADLSDIQAAESVKIIGSDSTGLETNPVNSSANGELNTSDISNNGGVNGAITVGTSAVEAKVGASILSNRKALTILLTSNGKLYYGLTSGVTTANGTQIFKNSLAAFKCGPGTSIWLISDTAAQNVRITEMA
jgi:hypothetical protein